MSIDLDSLIPGSQFFRWKEAIFFPKWNLYAYPPPIIHKNIIWVAQNIADPIRSLFNKPMQIHSWWRNDQYNKLIGGAPGSQHILGLAIDFSIYTVPIDEVRSVLEPRLEQLNARMELNTPTWVHIDGKALQPGESRTFNP